MHGPRKQLPSSRSRLAATLPRRTNVRKQASLSMVDPASNQDPARTSENVKMALSDSQITGPAQPRPKQKLELQDVFPQ